MNHLDQTPDASQSFHIPKLAWVLGAGILAAFIAVFVFGIPWNNVLYIAFIFLMMGGHLFMHGGHMGHGGHNDQGQNTNQIENSDQAADSFPGKKDQYTRHSGGCH